jgi:hypothetical protein
MELCLCLILVNIMTACMCVSCMCVCMRVHVCVCIVYHVCAHAHIKMIKRIRIRKIYYMQFIRGAHVTIYTYAHTPYALMYTRTQSRCVIIPY